MTAAHCVAARKQRPGKTQAQIPPFRSHRHLSPPMLSYELVQRRPHREHSAPRIQSPSKPMRLGDILDLNHNLRYQKHYHKAVLRVPSECPQTVRMDVRIPVPSCRIQGPMALSQGVEGSVCRGLLSCAAPRPLDLRQSSFLASRTPRASPTNGLDFTGISAQGPCLVGPLVSPTCAFVTPALETAQEMALMSGLRNWS